MADYRTALPQLADSVFLTDGGLETTLIFHDGLDLPEFAAFVLLDDEAGREALRSYFDALRRRRPRRRLRLRPGGTDLAGEPGLGGQARLLAERLDAANRAAIDLMVELRGELETLDAPVVISGCVGPRSDGYRPAELMTPGGGAALPRHPDRDVRRHRGRHGHRDHHDAQRRGDRRAPAAAGAGMPVVISFTVETDGRLPSGESLGEAIEAVDDATGARPGVLHGQLRAPDPLRRHPARAGRRWVSRVARPPRERLDDEPRRARRGRGARRRRPGRPRRPVRRAAGRPPHLTVLGGCCGTDHRHIERHPTYLPGGRRQRDLGLRDPDHVARGVAERAVARAPELVHRLLQHLGAGGAHLLERGVEVGGAEQRRRAASPW